MTTKRGEPAAIVPSEMKGRKHPMTDDEFMWLLERERRELVTAGRPTPTVGGGGQQCDLIPHKGHFLRPSGKKATLYLEQQAAQWSTLIASMQEKGGTYRRGNLTIKGQVEAFSRPDQQTGRGGLRTPSGEVLNPRFVEALMGLPDGMTDSMPLEMRSFHSWLATHSQRLRELLDSTSMVRRVA